jgi:hypothetical protein
VRAGRGLDRPASPNDRRREECWPASNDPTADNIEPPAMGGVKPTADGAGDKVAPSISAGHDDNIGHTGAQA